MDDQTKVVNASSEDLAGSGIAIETRINSAPRSLAREALDRAMSGRRSSALGCRATRSSATALRRPSARKGSVRSTSSSSDNRRIH